MTIKLLFHDPTIVSEDDALLKADTLGCPIVHHGLNKWTAGLSFGKDGYFGLVMCEVHDARREIKQMFANGGLTKANMDMVQDCPPDPPSQTALDKMALDTLATKPGSYSDADIKNIVAILQRRL